MVGEGTGISLSDPATSYVSIRDMDVPPPYIDHLCGRVWL